MRIRRLKSLRPAEVGVFFLFLSLIFPVFFFYSEHRIRDFFVVKLALIFLAQIFSIGQLRWRSSPLIASTALIGILGTFIFFNNFSEEKSIVLLTITLPLLYYQLTRQLEISAEMAITMLGIATLISVLLSLYHLGLMRTWRVGAVYIGGHFSAALLVLSVLFNGSNQWKLLALFDIGKGMAGRYLVFLIVVLSQRYAWIVGTALITSSYMYTLYVPSNFTFSAGYRIYEYVLVWEALQQCGYVFGCILGDPFTEYKLGSKGFVDVSGHFHNFWLICLYNLGFAGLAGLLCAFLRIVRKMGRFWYVGVAYMFMMLLDAPRDGHWIFGFLTGVIVFEAHLKQTRRQSTPAPLSSGTQEAAHHR
ncbi:hypothetical protein ACGYK3_18615 [Sulfitobacter sp. 1A05707]|uniref:hypothetical protein n=1 Tax=Sulfitobacter sp. 1A05707 TaxID=3368560 RepID=UPI003745BC93